MHVAIIMDGNRRWAEKNNCDLYGAYKNGCIRAIDIIKFCINKIQFLTLYAFSTENWSRSNKDIAPVMSLIDTFLPGFIEELRSWNVDVNLIGEEELFPDNLKMILKKYKKECLESPCLKINIAFSYGGRREIVNAMKKLFTNPPKNPQNIDEKYVSSLLYTKDFPDPDFLIRTGNSKRISNFLLWQIAYTELFFSEDLWPDFTIEKFQNAIDDYFFRKRTCGV